MNANGNPRWSINASKDLPHFAENAKKWHEHTVLMHEDILTFIHKLTALGFTEKIFFELTEVFEEYQIEFLELVGKEFDARTVKRLQKMMKKQITFFLKYEKKGV